MITSLDERPPTNVVGVCFGYVGMKVCVPFGNVINELDGAYHLSLRDNPLRGCWEKRELDYKNIDIKPEDRPLKTYYHNGYRYIGQFNP